MDTMVSEFITTGNTNLSRQGYHGKRYIFLTYLCAILVFITIASFFYLKESIGIPRFIAHTANESILVIPDLFPEYFMDDAVWSKGSPEYIPSHKALLRYLWQSPEHFMIKYKRVMFLLIFFTAISTFILFYNISGESVLSVLMVCAVLFGNIHDSLLEVDIGFTGVNQVLARYSAGIFIPLFILWFVKQFKKNSLYFCFFGMGLFTLFHPTMYNSASFLLLCIFIISNKFTWFSIKKALGFGICHLAGMVPFIVSSVSVKTLNVYSAEIFIAGPFVNPVKNVLHYTYSTPIFCLMSLFALYMILSKHYFKNEEAYHERILQNIVIYGYLIATIGLLVFSILPAISLKLAFIANGIMVNRSIYVVYICIYCCLLLGLASIKRRDGLKRITRCVIISVLLIAVSTGFNPFYDNEP